jgi:hypothetical protein
MFGLFKSSRKVAIEAAVQAIRPLIGSIQHSHGLPSGFWTNPYILGFFVFMGAHHAKLSTRGAIEGASLASVLTDILSTVSNMNGVALMERSVELTDSSDFDFNRGADDAAAVSFFVLKKLKNENENELVAKAKKVAAVSSDAGNTEEERRAYIASVMVALSLMNEVHRM